MKTVKAYKKQIIVCVSMAAVFAAMLILAFILDKNSSEYFGGNLYNTGIYFSVFGFFVWGLTFFYRMQGRILKIIIIAIASVCILWLFIRVIRWWGPADAVSRHLWYVFYIGFIGLPALWLFFMIENFHSGYRFKKHIYIALSSAAAVLLTAVFTNDLHQWVIRFPDGMALFSESYKHSWAYWIIAVFAVLSVLAAFALFVAGTIRRNSLKQYLLPFAIILCLILYLLMDMFLKQQHWPRIFKDITFAAVFFGFLLIEISLRCGLVQNSGQYERLFLNSKLPLCIVDENQTPLYKNKNFIPEDVNRGNEDYAYKTRAIPGGALIIQKDLSALNRLKFELLEKNRRLKRDNLILEHRKKLIEEEAALTARRSLLLDIEKSIGGKRREIEIMIASLPDVINADNKAETSRVLARIKMSVGYLKQCCMLNLCIKESGGISAEGYELMLSSMLKDAKSAKIKSACNAAGENIHGETAAGFMDFIAELCEVLAFKDVNLLINADFNESECRVVADKAVSAGNMKDIEKKMQKRRIEVSASGDDGEYVYTAKIVNMPKAGE